MTEQRNNGGAAFPGGHMNLGDGDSQPYCMGMSLRDWFAGQALAGLMPVCVNDTIEPGCWPQHIAKNAYEIADAMIAAREATQ